MGNDWDKYVAEFGWLFPEPDRQTVQMVLRIANGKRAGFKKRGSELEAQARAFQPEFAALIERAFERKATLDDPEFAAIVARVREHVPMRLEVVRTPGAAGPRLGYLRVVEDLRYGFDWALLMLLDSTMPFRKALSRCAHCKEFYLARRNPKGGPANRIYCSPKCRALAHNAGREIRREEAARKHK